MKWKYFVRTILAFVLAFAGVASASAAVAEGAPGNLPLLESPVAGASIGASLLVQSQAFLAQPPVAAAPSLLNPVVAEVSAQGPAAAQETSAALPPASHDAAVLAALPGTRELASLPSALDALYSGAKAGAADKAPGLGVDVSAMDPSVRPQDDLYRYVNGTWIKNFQMPTDKSYVMVFSELSDRAEAAVKAIVDRAVAGRHAPGTDGQKIAGVYQSFMNADAVEARGLRPLSEDLALIEGVQNKEALSGLFARALSRGVSTPIRLYVEPDEKNTAAYMAHLTQSGLGLPDRDCYFKDDERTAKIRDSYLNYVTTLLTLSGEDHAAEKAAAVFALERALAERQWTNVERRDPIKTYNKVAVSDLGAAAGGFDWNGYLRAAGIRSEETDVIVGEPSYFAGFTRVLADQPLESWKLYMKVRTLDASAPYLPKDYEEASFAYHGRTLYGQSEMEPRWKRGVALANKVVGELVGRSYVEEYFPESTRTRIQQLVENLRAAFRERILSREWMGEETKRKALEKLDKVLPTIGFPDHWRDYSPLRVDEDDLLGNVLRSNAFDYSRMVGKLGRPVDRGEWDVNPQVADAFNWASLNKIVFPAAILVAPFFDPAVDDAVNYGGIGMTIGHELSHSFDDEGSHFDGDGRLHDWWTPQDKAAFDARTAKVAEQFDAFEPLPGEHVNGKLTLGENIADLGGASIAYHAYMMSLHGAAAAIIDGFTGPQRFFMGLAQVWRSAWCDEFLRSSLATNPHSPPEYRANGVRNMPEFVEAFGAKEGDKLYLPEKDRVGIW